MSKTLAGETRHDRESHNISFPCFNSVHCSRLSCDHSCTFLQHGLRLPRTLPKRTSFVNSTMHQCICYTFMPADCHYAAVRPMRSFPRDDSRAMLFFSLFSRVLHVYFSLIQHLTSVLLDCTRNYVVYFKQHMLVSMQTSIFCGCLLITSTSRY